MAASGCESTERASRGRCNRDSPTPRILAELDDRTEALFSNDPYLKPCTARVLESGPDGIVLDRTVFYPLGGGQPGDLGVMQWDGQQIDVVDTRRRREDGAISHRPASDAVRPPVGTEVTARIDWALRYRHMRMHTCLHLLGAVLKFPSGACGQLCTGAAEFLRDHPVWLRRA